MIKEITTTSPYNELDSCLYINNTDSYDVAYNFGDILKIDDSYTFSCWFKSDKTIKTKIIISDSVSEEFTVGTNWNKIVYTCK